MKAVRIQTWGQPLEVVDIPQPMPAQDEVLVKVHAASINPFDVAVHAGYMKDFFQLPFTLGTDFSGEVVAVGQEVRHVKAGDEVYGLVPMHSGSFAEYVVAKSTEVTHKPKTLSHVESAGIPLPVLAAYQSALDIGQAKKGDHVLIIGAGGAVGSSALQMIKELGGHVYAVDILEKADFVHSLGPDRFIDARGERYEDVVDKVDLVLDYVYGENMQRAFGMLSPGGRYVTSMVFQPPQEEAEKRGIKAMGFGTQARVDQLDDIAQRIDSGRLKTFVNSTFPLQDVQRAWNYRMASTNPGKVVLTTL
jgi:NADPH:quinone reductase-like Zn-dependent oxidoreductase